MADPTPIQKSANHLWLWLVIGLIVIGSAGAAYYLVIRTNKNSNSANSSLNLNSNLNQNSAVNNDQLITTDTNTASADSGLTQYRNNAFGYTIEYNAYSLADPATLRSTWDIQNPAENLYSEWGLSEGDRTVIAISVYDSTKRDAVFASKNYTTVSETEALNSELTASYIKVNGEVRGYHFTQANYLFTLTTTYSAGSAGYDEFKSIARGLTFSLQPE